MARVVAVGSGKGGVGKSVVVAGLASVLARAGARVVAADLDVGGPNLAALFGLFDRATGIQDFLDRRIRRLEEALLPVAPRLAVLGGTGQRLASAHLSFQAKRRLLRALRGLDAEIVLFDVGAGCGRDALDFFAAAELGILVATPEPPSILDAFRFLKLAVLRMESRRFHARDPRRREIERVDLATLAELRERVGEPVRDGGRGPVRPPLAVELLANRATGGEPTLLRLRQTARRFLGVPLPLLGAIPDDPSVPRSVRSFLPVTEFEPRSPAAVALAAVGHLLGGRLRRADLGAPPPSPALSA